MQTRSHNARGATGDSQELPGGNRRPQALTNPTKSPLVQLTSGELRTMMEKVSTREFNKPWIGLSQHKASQTFKKSSKFDGVIASKVCMFLQ